MELLDIPKNRRFGVEIECNSFDGMNRSVEKLPKGIAYIAKLVSQAVEEGVVIGKYDYYHNSNAWILKQDSSCGIEICTPVLKGKLGLEKIKLVILALYNSKKIEIDSRCSFHVHINIKDFKEEEVASVLAYWVKLEPFFFDIMPSNRKLNRYCQCIGLCDLLFANQFYSPEKLISILGAEKYTSINSFHYKKGERHTIEFRIAGNTFCLNPSFAENWVQLLLHFVEMARITPYPENLNWEDLDYLVKFMSFDEGLSEDLLKVRNWFYNAMKKNCMTGKSVFDRLRTSVYSDIRRLSIVDE